MPFGYGYAWNKRDTSKDGNQANNHTHRFLPFLIVRFGSHKRAEPCEDPGEGQQEKLDRDPEYNRHRLDVDISQITEPIEGITKDGPVLFDFLILRCGLRVRTISVWIYLKGGRHLNGEGAIARHHPDGGFVKSRESIWELWSPS